MFHMAGTCSPSPLPSTVKIHSKLARRRSQRRVRAPGLQGRGFSFPVVNHWSWRLPRGEGESSADSQGYDDSSHRMAHGSWEERPESKIRAWRP